MSVPRILRRSVTCLLTCAALSIRPVAAQQTAADVDVGWMHQSALTGDWDGARDELKDKGITLHAHFVTESAANPTGGKSQNARYTQQVDFSADLDLGRLASVHGGTIQITFTDSLRP